MCVCVGVCVCVCGWVFSSDTLNFVLRRMLLYILKNYACNCRFESFVLRILRQVERKINNVINDQVPILGVHD